MIIVKERIRHNGVDYEEDDEIVNIDITEAERLVKLGVAFFMRQGIPLQNIEDIKLDKRELLDNAFNATELKEAAQEVGLEFPGNISKVNLIELIVSSEKADEVLSVEFEEYEEADE